jgi:hypothetical protein
MKLMQDLIRNWTVLVFGPRYAEITPKIRALRLLEEVLELSQAEDITMSEIATVTGQVFNKPKGTRFQELGGVGITLMGYCDTAQVDFESAFWAEFCRIMDPEIMEKVRTRNLAGDKIGFQQKIEQPLHYVCRVCGSCEVRVDAYATWNPRIQQNELTSTYDECVCEGDNGQPCNGNSTKCEEISADQDCHIEPHPDGEQRDGELIWLVVYNEDTYHVRSEAAARKVQSDWRESVGRDLETGEKLDG